MCEVSGVSGFSVRGVQSERRVLTVRSVSALSVWVCASRVSGLGVQSVRCV